MTSATQGSSSAAKKTPRIYVASLSDYNAGRLHGVWLEATDIERVRIGIAAMLKASASERAEEYAIHDFEGFSRYLPLEYSELELVCAIGAAIAEHGTIITAYFEHGTFPTDAEQLPELLTHFSESYQGAYESLEDWAEQYLQDTGLLQQVPQALCGYIDLESWANDAHMSGDIFAVELEGKTHVFSNH